LGLLIKQGFVGRKDRGFCRPNKSLDLNLWAYVVALLFVISLRELTPESLYFFDRCGISDPQTTILPQFQDACGIFRGSDVRVARSVLGIPVGPKAIAGRLPIASEALSLRLMPQKLRLKCLD
jgi:hypothetical protein